MSQSFQLRRSSGIRKAIVSWKFWRDSRPLDHCGKEL